MKFLTLIASSLACCISPLLFLQACKEASPDEGSQQTEEISDTANKICPISGKPIDGKTAFNHNNTRIHFCSPTCAITFAENIDRPKTEKGSEQDVSASSEQTI